MSVSYYDDYEGYADTRDTYAEIESRIGVSNKCVRHCEDQITSPYELHAGHKYVIVSIATDEARLIKVDRVGTTNGGKVLYYTGLNDDLEPVSIACSAYLTDLGVMAYEYRGQLTWNSFNYVRALRSTDYNNDMRLKTASRLLMFPKRK